MAKHPARTSGIEVAPLLIIGTLTLIALSLWLWQRTRLETVKPKASLVIRAPGVRAQAPTPKPKDTLDVPKLPEGVIGAHWQAKGSRAVLRRPDNSELSLTIVPHVQTKLKQRLASVRVPYGAVVLMDIKTGAIRAWVEHTEANEPAGQGYGLTRAVAPAASIFKVVTAAALLESGVSPATETCYRGGRRGIQAKLLKDSPQDSRCASLGMALAKSANVIFGKQAVRRLSAGVLTATAEDFFFSKPLPFDVGTQPSRVHIGQRDIDLARTAAGFVGTTLSPLHGAAMAAAVANDGVMMRPFLVEKDSLQPGRKRQPAALGRVLAASVASDLQEMMALTVSAGTGQKQFKPWPKSLSHISAAGKTGTLATHKDGQYRHHTWFVGFAPADNPQIAVAALAVNGKRWRTRGPSLARFALTTWFSSERRRAKLAREKAKSKANRK
ncbi:MAG: penicillin-binding protein [Myxococcales bacterium]|nr:penicillin-binding protein [Myxococcales bacterium]